MVKKIPKILKLIFVLIFVFQLIGLAVLFALPEMTQAADSIKFKPQVTIPGGDSSFSVTAEKETTIDGNSIGNYIKLIYKYAIGIVGILATIVMMIGGFMWLIAGGNQSKISEAQEWIKASLTGLVLALGSYMILATVNPALVTFKKLDITSVSEPGCCQDTSSTCSSKSQTSCEGAKGTWKSGYSCGSKGKCEKSSTTTTTTTSTETTCSAINKEEDCTGDCEWSSTIPYGEGFISGCTTASPSTQTDICSTAATGAPCNDSKGYCENGVCNACKSTQIYNAGCTKDYQCDNDGKCGAATPGDCNSAGQCISTCVSKGGSCYPSASCCTGLTCSNYILGTCK